MISRIKRLLGRDDTNFIGFDKYRLRGAYHWDEARSNTDYRALIDAIAAHLQPQDDVLDIGCGDGAYLGVVAGRIRNGFGIDAEKVAINLAREKFAQHGIGNCEVQNWRIDEAMAQFAASGQRFDVVYSADVIEHLPHPGELPELAARVLRPGGTALIGTPLFISDKLVSPYHVKEYTQPEIRAILAESLIIERDVVLPHSRKDGRTYRDGYYLGVCRLKPA